MSAPPRELRITYGTTAIGGTLSSATLTLHEVHSISKTADDFSVSFSTLLTATTTTIFAAGCIAFEDALNTRRQALLVQTLDSAGSVDQTLLSLTHTANTALNIAAEVTKAGGPHDTNLSRLYEVTISGELPTKTALAGLREFEYDVTFSPSRRGTLLVRGSYTAVASTQAAAQYLASIAARVSSITTALTGTWELVDESYTPDDTDQVVRFTRTYQELLYKEASSTLNKAQIVDQVLVIKTDRIGSEGVRQERRLATLTATYSCSVDKSQTQDLTNLWDSVIRPWIIKNIEDVAATTKLAITVTSLDYDYPENKISATITAQARTGSDTVALIVTCADDVEMGKIITYTWPSFSSYAISMPTEAYIFQGPKKITRTITVTRTYIGDPNMPALGDDGGAGGGGGGRGMIMMGDSPLSLSFGGQTGSDYFSGTSGALNFEVGTPRSGRGGRSGGGSGKDGDFKRPGVLIRHSLSQTPRTIGLPNEQLTLTDEVHTDVYEVFTKITAAAAGGGSTTTGVDSGPDPDSTHTGSGGR